VPLTISEGLLYSTVKLTATKSGVPISTGTGFFISLANTGDRSVFTIVTNKHVLKGADQIIASLHFADGDRPSGRFTPCAFPIAQGTHIFHPDPGVDLCALFVGPFLNLFAEAGTPIFCAPTSLDIVPKEDDWEFFDAIEDVTMVGCPNGISDETNSLPLVRRGITATSLSKPYNGKNEFMVDMACFPGSSGSPIFIFDRHGYFDRRTGNQMLGAQRIVLVGILYAGPLISNEGKIVLGQPPKVEVAAMMHLGNAIKSSELRVLDNEVRRMLP